MAVDLIGPWKVQVRGKPYKFNTLTCVDNVTNLVKIVSIDCETLQHITGKFAQVGWQDTLGQYDVSTITVGNSQDRNSKSSFKSVM